MGALKSKREAFGLKKMLYGEVSICTLVFVVIVTCLPVMAVAAALGF